MWEIRPNDVERLAREMHNLLREQLSPDSPYRGVPYDELAEPIKEANRQQVLRAPALLGTLGYNLEYCGEGADTEVRSLSDEEVELAAIAEHNGWMRQKTHAGYRFGVDRDDQKRTHPALVPWEQLSEPVRELDRQRVRLLPRIACGLGLRIVR